MLLFFTELRPIDIQPVVTGSLFKTRPESGRRTPSSSPNTDVCCRAVVGTMGSGSAIPGWHHLCSARRDLTRPIAESVGAISILTPRNLGVLR